MAAVPALTNWAGNVVFGAARVHEPSSLDELRRVVAANAHVRAFGSGHSFSALAETPHDLVRLKAMPRLVDIDPARMSARVGAGMRYVDFMADLDAAGVGLANMASLPHITVAGSCATGTHGSGDELRVLPAAVRSLQLVGPEGDLVTLDRHADRQIFAGAVVNLGALGVVVDVTLDVVPRFEVAQRLHVGVPLGAIADDLDAVFGGAYSVSVFTNWRDGTATVWFKSRAEDAVPECVGGAPADCQINPCPGMPPESCSEQLGVLGPWHERLPHFRPGLTPGTGDELQSEYFVPRSAAASAFAGLADIADLIAPSIHIGEVRSVHADDLWLSPAHGHDMITFHFTWLNDLVGIGPVMAAVEERLLPLGARPHWAKLTGAPPSKVIARYERADDFRGLREAFDPTGKFSNAYLDALFPH